MDRLFKATILFTVRRVTVSSTAYSRW